VASNSDYSGFLGEKISGLIAKEQQQIGRSRTMNALDLESISRRKPASRIKASQSGLVAGKSRGGSNEV
jgi:hypothetical protein